MRGKKLAVKGRANEGSIFLAIPLVRELMGYCYREAILAVKRAFTKIPMERRVKSEIYECIKGPRKAGEDEAKRWKYFQSKGYWKRNGEMYLWRRLESRFKNAFSGPHRFISFDDIDKCSNFGKFVGRQIEDLTG